jgi:hypothetical protein
MSERLIIAGSRDLWLPLDLIGAYVERTGLVPDEVVSGGASGIDRCGERWAKSRGVPVKQFRADWLRYGPSAGPIRNRTMAQYATAALLIWDGREPTPGTASMLVTARKAGLPLFAFGGPHVASRAEPVAIPADGLHQARRIP